MGAGSLVGLIVNFLVVGLIFGTFGFVVDKIIAAANSNIGGLVFSQDAMNTMGNISFCFKIIPFLYLIALVINHLIESSNESSREV